MICKVKKLPTNITNIIFNVRHETALGQHLCIGASDIQLFLTHFHSTTQIPCPHRYPNSTVTCSHLKNPEFKCKTTPKTYTVKPTKFSFYGYICTVQKQFGTGQHLKVHSRFILVEHTVILFEYDDQQDLQFLIRRKFLFHVCSRLPYQFSGHSVALHTKLLIVKFSSKDHFIKRCLLVTRPGYNVFVVS